jgi:hypothetical protein
MEHLHGPMPIWLGQQIGSEHYADEVFLRYPWHGIVSEVKIFEY